MKDHLLSIFPLQGVDAYARVSCIVLEDVSTDCNEPFTTSRSNLASVISEALPKEETEAIFARLDLGQPVQIAISTSQARIFGFVPKVN